MDEVKKLNKALNEFNNAMQKKLEDKALNHEFTGWDEGIPAVTFVWELVNRSLQMLRQGITKNCCVNIANYAMFIYHRVKE